MRVALISDTHLPRGERRIPGACVDALRAADLIVHAGDLMRVEVLDWFESLGPPLAAVQGNVDDAEVRRRLPIERTVELGGARLGVIHDAGPARGRLSRLRRRFPGTDGVVFGHSHLPLHEREGDFQIFNPGSPTERRRAPRHSFGWVAASGRRLAFEHVWL